MNHELTLPLTPRQWWEIFIRPNRKDDLSTVCNAILAVGETSDVAYRRIKNKSGLHLGVYGVKVIMGKSQRLQMRGFGTFDFECKVERVRTILF
jgi:hypothetical protein